MRHRPTVYDIKSNLIKHRKQACQLDPRAAVVPFSKHKERAKYNVEINLNV
jgi:hypothetical protein